MRGYLFQTYKILWVFWCQAKSKRAHSYKIRGRLFKTEVPNNFFLQRLMNLRKSQSQDMVEPRSTSTFKLEIDKYAKVWRIEGLGELSQKRSWGVNVLNGRAGLRDRVAFSCSHFLVFLCNCASPLQVETSTDTAGVPANLLLFRCSVPRQHRAPSQYQNITDSVNYLQISPLPVLQSDTRKGSGQSVHIDVWLILDYK